MKKKVLLIGLDGTRPDSISVVKTPNLDKLASKGVFSWNAQTEIQCISGSGWTSLLTGVHTEKHGVFDNEFSSRDLQYKSISRLLMDWNPQIRCIAHSNWKPIITDIFEKGTLSNSSSGPDKKMTKRMCQDIDKDRGDFYFIQLDRADRVGHNHTFGPNSPKYLKAIEKVDECVGHLLDVVDSRPSDENWLVCLVSDHGGSGKQHNLVEIKGPKELTIPLIIAGNSVIAKGELKLAEIVDVLPTISKFFDMPPKEYWDGKIRGL